MDDRVGEEEDMHIKLDTIKDITNNFAMDRCIGGGGYGNVYKALYNGKNIAVKRIHRLERLDDTAFENEFRNLCKIRHPNIVRLIGYCYDIQRKFVDHEGKTVFAYEMERVLCFEFVEGGDLEKHIRAEPCGFNWPTCFKIIKDTCEGLHRLHTAAEKPILHLDLKPANILLDKVTKTAKIGDLGLSRLISKTLYTERIKGTCGYMPREFLDNGAISNKFDVFSLGVLILKIVAGTNLTENRSEMPHKQFTDRVTANWKNRMQGRSGHSTAREKDISQVETCIRLALICVRPDRRERPNIEDIVDELKELEPRVDEISFDSADMPQCLVALQDSAVTAPLFKNSNALCYAAEDFKKKLYQMKVDTAWQPGNLINNMAKELDNLTKKVNNMAKELNKW